MGNASTSLVSALASGTKVSAQPWPRVVVGAPRWEDLARGLGQGAWTLVSVWGDRDQIHMALAGDDYTDIAIATLACPDRRFPSVGCWHAPAQRLERAIADLFGLMADGAPDPRPWLNHGKWPSPPPQRIGPVPPAQTYDFLRSDGEGLHQIPVGPVHAGIIEPGHFRFTANGETVVRLEERLGYVHKGIDALLIGAPVSRAARLAARVSGDSTVAYGIAFARAVEAAASIEIPRRAHWLRALMGELERLANHLGDIGAICNDASFALMQAHCTIYREKVLRLAESCFGHRLMMDRVIPGGVCVDLDSAGAAAARALIAEIRRRFPELMEVYDNTASLQDRTVATGIAAPELVRKFGCGGYIGRASGRNVDMRRAPAYPPYPELSFTVPVQDDGDVNARVWIRMHEVQQSLGLIEQIVDALPSGSRGAEIGAIPANAEGAALVEGFRGDIFAWVRFGADGAIARCHLRDPSWFQWPVLEAAIEGNIVADFPLCNKSFNCSYSGHDL